MRVPVLPIAAALMVSTAAAAWSPSTSVLSHDGPIPDSQPRCYDLIFGRWTIETVATDLHEPRGIALSGRPFRTRSDTVEYWAVGWSTDPLQHVGTWRRAAPDSVSVRFPSWGSWGLRLQLAQYRDSVAGQAQVYGDFTSFKPAVATVRGPRVSCPALPVIGDTGA